MHEIYKFNFVIFLQAKGKIVVYNEEYEGYKKIVVYRNQGANKAAEVGALAVLIRSITPFSFNTPHTYSKCLHYY